VTVNPEELLAHADFVRHLARSLVADEHRAADIAQDTWLAALEHPPATGDSLKSWLSKVLRNFRRKLLRREVRQVKREYAAARPDRSPSTEEVVAREEIRQRVVGAVLDLDEPYRSVILLRYYENLPPRTVAETLDAPLETVKTRLHRGLEKLRERLDRVHGDDRKSWCLSVAPLAGLSFTAASGCAAAGSGAAAAGALSVSSKITIGAAAILLIGATIAFCLLVGQDGEMVDPQQADSAAAARRTGAAPPGDRADASAILAGLRARQPLAATVQVSGHVVDGSCQRPVSGATVLLSMKEEPRRVETATTDRSGRFVFGGIEKPGTAWLAIRAPGYSPRVLDIDDVGGTALVFDELELRPRWCCRGRVIGPDGSPFAGARITGIFDHRFPKFDDQQKMIREESVTTSGPDGSFLFCSGDDRSERHLAAPGAYRAEAEGLVSIWTSRNDGAELLLPLEAARDITGEVVWSRGGSPVVGATVRCADKRDPNLEKLNVTHVGHDGSFLFDSVPDRDLDVGVYVQSPTSTRNRPECVVTASEGCGDLGTLVVKGPASLHVRVRDKKKGEAIEGASIGYGDSGFTMGAAVTDRSGLAQIDNLPSERTLFLSPSLPWESKSQRSMRHKSTPTRIISTGLPGTTTTADLILSTEPFWEDDPPAPPEVPVAGVVKNSGGEPIAGARVEFFIDGSPEPPDPDPIMRNRKLFLRDDFKEGSHPNYPAGRSGRFSFTMRYVPGIHTIRNVTVTHPYHVPIWLPGAALASRNLEELSFTLEPTTEWLSGAVRAESGEPVSRCNVRCVYTVAEAGNEKVAFTYHPATDDEGRFHVPYVPDMILTCQSAPAGYEGGSVRSESNRLRQTAGASIPIVVKKKAPPPPDESAPPRYSVSVRSVSSAGSPMSGIEVTAWGLDGESFDRGVNGVGSPSEWYKGLTGTDGRVSVETDHAGLGPVRWCLFKKSLLTSRSILIFEDSRTMQPGADEKPISLPAGQVVELLVVYQGISDAVAGCVDLLPTGSVLELVPEGGGAAVDLKVEKLEEERRFWFTNHEELRYGAHRALAVRRLVPNGSYRLTVEIPGYIPHLSPVVTFLDSDEILSLVVEIELQN